MPFPRKPPLGCNLEQPQTRQFAFHLQARHSDSSKRSTGQRAGNENQSQLWRLQQEWQMPDDSERQMQMQKAENEHIIFPYPLSTGRIHHVLSGIAGSHAVCGLPAYIHFHLLIFQVSTEHCVYRLFTNNSFYTARCFVLLQFFTIISKSEIHARNKRQACGMHDILEI